jgi:hypothetical protein
MNIVPVKYRCETCKKTNTLLPDDPRYTCCSDTFESFTIAMHHAMQEHHVTAYVEPLDAVAALAEVLAER